MEETLQQEKKDLEYQNPNDDQGGIRRRLRDRDLLRKRKAEAEQKETNQLESQRKRPRADEKSGTKKRGRPRKTEPTPEISVIQEEAAAAPEAPAVVAVPEPAGVIPDQTSGSLTPLLTVGGDTLESQPASSLAAPAVVPLLGSVQSPVFAPALTSPAPVNPSPAGVPAPSPAKSVNTAPVPAPDAVSVPALSQVPVPAAAPAPPLVETLYTESQGRETIDQVLIEDLGPDEEEDISLSQEKRADEDLTETPQISVPEQNKMFSVPTLSSPPPSQEYLPGN
ncbi:skin secretory protein xP2 isoform X2 [Anabas testudineus]|uniref:skin secretory protein xP2 isoform X2 n=1 Tax=Anabas testudineus TaxID=64144 RepID=UPI000E458151|nr:skin secretory protein xP2 isoform X2 [Anabas testudineus]